MLTQNPRMKVESATDNVWAEASYDQHDDNVASSTSASQHKSVTPSVISKEQTEQTEDVADDDQTVNNPPEIRSNIRQVCKIMAVKAWRARYASLAIFGFICCVMLTHLMICSTATAIRGVLMPSYRLTTHHIDSIKSEQSLLLSKLDELQHINLPKRPFDTHMKCLIRATNIAQDHYGDLPYQSNQLIAEYTTQWAQSECDRVIFTPVPIPRSDWQHFWIALTDHAEAAFFRCKDILDGLLKAKSQRSQKSSMKAHNVQLSLPSGFQLDCNEAESLCQLLFLQLHSPSTPGSQSIEEMILIIRRRRLFQIVDGCKRVSNTITMVWWVLPWMNLIALTLVLVFCG